MRAFGLRYSPQFRLIDRATKTPTSIQSFRNPRHTRSKSTRIDTIPRFAFAFDIDGVLLRSSAPIPGATETLRYLQSNRIPFVLLTNGGGKTEKERVSDLSSLLSVDLDTSMFIQSHTPFADFVGPPKNLKDKCVLVMGGDGSKCREVAETYGFTKVVTPGDIYAAHPEIWPFSKSFLPTYYSEFARPLPKPINPHSPKDSLKIDAVFVFNDLRDWGLGIQLLLDVMLSEKGILGTYSSKNGDRSLPNNGYLQDGQPPLYYSNPDLLWAAKYHLSRLGQGGFREAFEGVWAAVTGGLREGAELKQIVMGKPFRETYLYAEKILMQHRKAICNLPSEATLPQLERVYMVGDNPESDIRGANTFESPNGIDWISLLVKTGVYQDRPGSSPSWAPRRMVDNVKEAVKYALRDSTWSSDEKLE